MRKLFEDRASLTVYLERTDLAWLTAKAKTRKMTAADYARVLILADMNSEASDTQTVRAPDSVRLAERGASALERATKPPGDASEYTDIELEVSRRTGHEPRHDCFQCHQTARFIRSTLPKQEKAKKK
jgi:hypothetical protein